MLCSFEKMRRNWDCLEVKSLECKYDRYANYPICCIYLMILHSNDWISYMSICCIDFTKSLEVYVVHDDLMLDTGII